MTLTWAPRPRRPLFALFAADAVSLSGNVVSLVAIPWFVIQTTGSPTKTGLTAFFNFLPTVLAAFFGGNLVDRIGFKRTSVLADLASALPVALIPLLHATVGLRFWQLLALVFLGALLDAPGTTARQALVPDSAAGAGWSLERAASAHAVIERASRLAGAPLAGLLIGILGPTGVLWLNALSFAISAAVVWAFVPPSDPAPRAEDARYLAEMKEGLSFMWNERLLRTIAITVMMTNLLDAALYVVLPFYADHAYGTAFSLGLLLGASGAGAVIGALVYGAWGHKVSRRKVYCGGFIFVSSMSLVLAFFPPLALAVLLSTVVHIGAGPLNPIIDAIEYERVPVAMRGRVFGAVRGLAWMAMPAGVLIGGFLLEWSGLRPSLLVLGAVYLATALTLLVNRSIRKMDDPVPRPTLQPVRS